MKKSTRLYEIDALRGLAAIGVAWFHLFTQNGGEAARAAVPGWFSLVSVWGRFGVQLFFVLSGFVLAYTLIEQRRVRSITDVGRYFVRRSIRLDPTYWAVLVIYVPGLWVLSSFPDAPAIQINKIQSFRDALGNILYFVPSIGGSRMLPVVWTLALEVQLYIFFSFSLYVAEILLQKTRWDIQKCQLLLLSSTCVLACLWPLRILHSSDSWLWAHLYNFMLGVAACMLMRRIYGWKLINVLTVVPTVIAFVLTRSSYPLASLIAFAIVLLVGLVGPVKGVMRSRVFMHLGNWSYSIYLTHSIIGACVIEALQAYVGGPLIFNILYIVVGVLVTILVSYALWRFVELPSISASKRIPLADGLGAHMANETMPPAEIVAVT